MVMRITPLITHLSPHVRKCSLPTLLASQNLTPLQVQDAFARKKHQLERAVKTAVVRMRNKMQALEQQQAATEKAEATRKQADLLTANLWKCKQGDNEVEV